jgi:predicted RNase H-like HicB family nuclease
MTAKLPAFARYIGIDYSGAETASSSLKGLRVYVADRRSPPVEVPPPPSPRWYWSRREIAEWLVERLAETVPTLVGIDHGFSFPIRYFEKHRLPRDWPAFLEDFQRHWPTDDDIYVDFVRDGSRGNGAARTGYRRWRRLTEERTGSAKSVFHFDVQGSVAKSTHAGIPWLLFIRRRLGERVHFWPFDGWQIPPGRSAVAEVYPRLWSGSYPREDRTADQHDAYSVAAWLREADRDGRLEGLLAPTLDPKERAIAEVEGWILGVPPVPRETPPYPVSPRKAPKRARRALVPREERAARYAYRVSWSPDDREFVAVCLDFPELSGLGATQEEALAEARAAVTGWLAHVDD